MSLVELAWSVRASLERAGGDSAGHETAIDERRGAACPPYTAKRPGAKRPQSKAPHIAAAAQAEAKILELIRDQPLKTSQIAKLTEAKVDTVTERMKRLRAKGLATSGDSGWQAVA